MKPFLLLLLMLGTFGLEQAQAQITITREELLALYAKRDALTIRSGIASTVGAEAIVNDRSTNAVYDLTGFNYTSFTTADWNVLDECFASCGTPGLSQADLFTEVNFEDDNTDDNAGDSLVYVNYNFEENGLFVPGIVLKADVTDQFGGRETVVLTSTGEPFQFLPLPLRVDATSTSNVTANVVANGFSLGTVQVSETVIVEGAGTLRLPVGEFPALKLRRTRQFTGELVEQFLGESFNMSEIEFITEAPVGATIALDENGAPTTVAYTVFRLDVPSPSEEEEDAHGLKLAAAAPNPVRSGAATIAFETAHAGHVSLRLFDALGRQVGVLADGIRPAGRHSLRLDAGSLSAGVYAYVLEAGGRSVTRTLVVVK